MARCSTLAARRRGIRRGGRGGDDERKPRKKKRGIVAFLLASAVPLAAIGVWVAQPEERKQAILEKVPSGVGGRAIAAGVSFGILLLLARIALPAFHGASGALRAALFRLREKPKAVRILLFPVEFLVYLLWLGLQLLFAVDAFLILVAAAVGLLLVIRIIKPDFLPAILPDFAE